MSYGKQLKVFNESGKLAPNDFCEQIIKFERLVFDMRKMQKENVSSSKELIKIQIEVDEFLYEMGWNEETLF